MLELGSCSNQTSSLEESRETLVSLSSEGLEEETMGPSRATLWTHVIMDSSRGESKLHQGRKEDKAFIHVQNSICSLTLNVGMADSKLTITTYTVEIQCS